MPPAAELETRRVTKGALAANLALRDFNHAIASLPNPSLLLKSMVLQEARLSSEIENIVTTDDELYQAPAPDTDPAAKEVIRYQEAAWLGFRALQEGRPLDSQLAKEVAARLLDEPVELRAGAGTRVAAGRRGPVVYTPPQGAALLNRLLDNLFGYLAEGDDIDPLVKMAAAHYQFEAIHPFRDGNGRTGRILNVLYLVQQGLLSLPVLYLSKFLIARRAAYYQGIRMVTESGEWEPWILFMLEAAEVSSEDGARRIGRIVDAMERMEPPARAALGRRFNRRLLELLFALPYVRIAQLGEVGIAKRDAASNILRDLADAGLLEPVRRGREVLYLNKDLLAILTEG